MCLWAITKIPLLTRRPTCSNFVYTDRGTGACNCGRGVVQQELWQEPAMAVQFARAKIIAFSVDTPVATDRREER